MSTTALMRNKNGSISYMEGGEGTPVLCLHGFPGSSYSWETVALNLMKNHPGKYYFIIPDLLGFGESDVPSDDSLFIKGQSAQLAKFLTRLNISDFYLVAHDFGGPVALTLLEEHPNLKARKLVLSSTNLFTDTPIPLPLRSAKVPVLGNLVYKAMAGSRFGFRMMYQFAAVNKANLKWADFERHVTKHGMESTSKIFQYSLADLEKNYRPIQTYASRLSLPTMILWGDRDPFFPVSVANGSHKTISNSILKIYPQTGHFVPEERSNEVANDIALFLSG